MGPLGMGLGADKSAKKPMAEYEAPEEETEEVEEAANSVPPDFQAAYDEWEAAPSAESLYAVIEACKSGGESGGGGGLLALIGKPKGKK